jgi:hypothetical protein
MTARHCAADGRVLSWRGGSPSVADLIAQRIAAEHMDDKDRLARTSAAVKVAASASAVHRDRYAARALRNRLRLWRTGRGVGVGYGRETGTDKRRSRSAHVTPRPNAIQPPGVSLTMIYPGPVTVRLPIPPEGMKVSVPVLNVAVSVPERIVAVIIVPVG